MNRRPKLSIVGAGPPDCAACGYGPCACRYIVRLEPGGDMHWLAGVALAQMGLPRPHREACPCPDCWSERMASWSREAGL